MKEIEIGLWRNIPSICSLQKDDEAYPIDRIFPSGRQALTYTLIQVGLNRPKRIALPEWSSHCIISAVGITATPIPMNEVVKHNIKVDAVLLYEQWGWPIPRTLKSQLLQKFKNAIFILDRVDSADIDNENRINFFPEADQVEIISFSKLLGLIGGGLAKLNGNYLYFKPKINDQELNKLIWNNEIFNPFCFKLLKFHKNQLESLHPELSHWLLNNNLPRALQIESSKRRKNLSLIIDSALSSNWPDWMINAFKEGVSPCIIPLLKNQPLNFQNKIQQLLLKSFNVETTIYHFNWSGNPLNPKYENILAFPIHGMIEDKISDIISKITKLIK